VEVGDSIPAKLYQAVAEILALVFRAEAEVRKAEAARGSRNASGERTEKASSIPAGGATR
jgi:flagellar biosynthesis protein FlhB